MKKKPATRKHHCGWSKICKFQHYEYSCRRKRVDVGEMHKCKYAKTCGCNKIRTNGGPGEWFDCRPDKYTTRVQKTTPTWQTPERMSKRNVQNHKKRDKHTNIHTQILDIKLRRKNDSPHKCKLRRKLHEQKKHFWRVRGHQCTINKIIEQNLKPNGVVANKTLTTWNRQNVN